MEQTMTETSTQAEAFAEAARVSAANEIERKQASRPPRSFMEKMACKLTPEEREAFADKIDELHEELEALEDEKKNANDGFKARMSLIEERIRELRGMRKSNTEMREVEVVEEFVFATNTVTVTRVDTKELVRKRAMTMGERQLTLEDAVQDDDDDDAEEDEPVDRNAETEPPPPPADGTAIDDPQAVLDGEAPAEGEKPNGKRVRRGRKSS